MNNTEMTKSLEALKVLKDIEATESSKDRDVKLSKNLPLIKEVVQDKYKLDNLIYSFGCPLKILYGILILGIWYEDESGKMVNSGVSLDTNNYNLDFVITTYDKTHSFLLSAYKTKYWLRRDKSK